MKINRLTKKELKALFILKEMRERFHMYPSDLRGELPNYEVDLYCERLNITPEELKESVKIYIQLKKEKKIKSYKSNNEFTSIVLRDLLREKEARDKC